MSAETPRDKIKRHSRKIVELFDEHGRTGVIPSKERWFDAVSGLPYAIKLLLEELDDLKSKNEGMKRDVTVLMNQLIEKQSTESAAFDPEYLVFNYALSACASLHGVTEEDIKGKLRKPIYVTCRTIVSAVCKDLLGHSFRLVRNGEMLGGRDHSTVIHLLRRHEYRLSEPRYRDTFNTIKVTVFNRLKNVAQV